MDCSKTEKNSPPIWITISEACRCKETGQYRKRELASKSLNIKGF